MVDPVKLRAIVPPPIYRSREPTRITEIVGGFVDDANQGFRPLRGYSAAVRIDGVWYWARGDDAEIEKLADDA